MNRQDKKPGFLYRLFFKDPYRDIGDLPEVDWQPNPLDEWPAADIPSPPYLGNDRPFGAAPTLKRWVKLQISSAEIQANMELHDFPIEIGSAPCSIQLQGKGISPRHAIMDLHGGVLTITDANSKHGVSIGNAWLDPGIDYIINAGDIILIGRTKITVLDYAKHAQTPKTQEIFDPEDIMSPDEIMDALEDELASITPLYMEITDDPILVSDAVHEDDDDFIDKDIKALKWEEEISTSLPTEEFVENQPEPEPEPNPEPEPEPILDMQPTNKKTTLVKLMDEPDASLFFHVLDMKEPTQEEPAQPEDILLVEEIVSKEVEEKIEEKAIENIIEDTIEEPTKEIVEENLDETSDKILDEVFDEIVEETLEETQNEVEEELARFETITTEEIIGEELTINPAYEAPEQEVENQIPELDLSAEEFIEALIEKSAARPTPSWKMKDLQEPELGLNKEPKLEPKLESKPKSEPIIEQESKTDPEITPTEASNKICHKCSTANSENDKFCGACGTALGLPAPQVKAFCGQCGTKNEYKFKFCGECGHKLS